MPASILPGCYGSAVSAQPGSTTCLKCPVMTACFETADSNEEAVAKALTRKMVGTDTDAKRINKFLSDRKPQPQAKSGNARADKLLERFNAERIDLSAMRSKRNPFTNHTNHLWYWMADFVMKGFPFKPKDMTEHVQMNCPTGITIGSLKSEVARFASALVAAGILERRESYILCLAT